MSNLNLVLIDAGHGGLDANGNYTTSPRDGKRFDHKDKSLNFHGIAGNSVFYEGVSNRIFAQELAAALSRIGIAHHFVFDPVKDTARKTRIDIANKMHRERAGNTILLSLHSNASGNGTARGWFGFTSVGTTRADRLNLNLATATIAVLHSLGIEQRPSRMLREKNFDMVAKTTMPAVLIETLFFDNLQDARLLNDISVVRAFCQAYAQGILAYFAGK